MPFVSEAQRRFLWANHPQIAKRWAAHTPKSKKLPLHAKQAMLAYHKAKSKQR